jgi:hypothetical protein
VKHLLSQSDHTVNPPRLTAPRVTVIDSLDSLAAWRRYAETY